MKVNVIASIIDFLQDHDSVSIPGLGSFHMHSVRRKFEIEGNSVKPPKKIIEFKDETGETSSFRNYLADQWNTTLDQAEEIIAKFSSQLVDDLLESGEAILPGMGHFSQNEGNQIGFVAEDKNFHLKYYGLPDIMLTPVMATDSRAGQKIPATTKPQAAVAERIATDKSSSWIRSVLALLLFIVLVILTMRACDNHISNYNGPRQFAAGSMGEDGVGDSISFAEAPGMSFFDSMVANNPNIEKYQEVLTDEIIRTGCIIIVGSFKNPRYAVLMKDRLIRDGLQPYTEVYGDFTRVGVLFDCGDQDLVEYIKDMRQVYHPRSWYLSPELEVPH